MSEVDDLYSLDDDFDDFRLERPEAETFPDTAEGQLAQRVQKILMRIRDDASEDNAFKTNSKAVHSLPAAKLHHRICSIFDRPDDDDEGFDQATDLTALSCVEAIASSCACRANMDEAINALMSRVLGSGSNQLYLSGA